VSYGSIFIAFSRIGLCGFGGVAAWAHRVLVDERRWYSDREFADLLSIGSILPGPNVCNISIVVGDQFRGPLGAATALTGLLAGPLLILVCLALLYDRYGDLPLVQAVIGGVTAAAAGLIFGTVIKLARRLRPRFSNVLVGMLAFLGAAVLHLHVLLIVALMVPLSIALALRERRR
jgi:chromate transporter